MVSYIANMGNSRDIDIVLYCDKTQKIFIANGIISLLTYMFFPVVALAIQIWFYGIALLNIANTISILMLFFATQVERSKILVKQEQELTNAKIDTMISQIQPHFLYNSLAAIKGLCNEDPKKARKAIEDFSIFF